MHILLIHQAFATVEEPGGTRHHELARVLAARGHRVTIVGGMVGYLTGKNESHSRWVERRTLEPGITLLRSYTYNAFHRSFVHRVLGFVSFMISSFLVSLRVGKVDVVWGTSPPIFQAATAWLIAWLRRVPWLFEVRDLWPDFAIAVGVLKNPVLQKASKGLERFLYRRAQCVMVNSPGYVAHVKKEGARRVELIANGVDPSMFDPAADGEAFRQSLGLMDCFVILYAGAHGLSNDLGVVLDAAAQLQDQPQIRFVLVGDGKEKANLQTQAQGMGLTNVLFLPPVAKDRMGEVLAAADACLAILKPLDLYRTTYPNKVFDYMAAGRAVLLAIEGVIQEVVEAAGAGIAVPPGDASALAKGARMLAANTEDTRAMGLSGRRYVEQHFNRQDQAEKLVVLIEHLVSKK